MNFTHSRTALDLKLEIYEVEMLIELHRENQWRQADKEEYEDADRSKQRAEQLACALTEHRIELSAHPPAERP